MVLWRRKTNICVNLITAGTEEFNVLSRSHVNNAHTFCKVCRADFNIGHGGENAISQHIISQRYIRAAEAQKGITKHTMLMLCTMLQCNVNCSTVFNCCAVFRFNLKRKRLIVG